MPEAQNVELYRSASGEFELEVRADAETVWLSADQLGELFGRDKSTISRHLRNVFEDGELDRDARPAARQEADIVAKKGKDVRAIMSKKIISVTEETTVEEIAQLMTTHKIKRLPVMKGDKVVGIVSRADIVSAIALGKHVALHTPVYDL